MATSYVKRVTTRKHRICRGMKEILANPIQPLFTRKGRSFRFRKMPTSKVEMEKSIYVLTVEELGCVVYSDTQRELKDELAETLYMLWTEYALESDDKLTPGGLELKRKVLEYVEEVGE